MRLALLAVLLTLTAAQVQAQTSAGLRGPQPATGAPVAASTASPNATAARPASQAASSAVPAANAAPLIPPAPPLLMSPAAPAQGACASACARDYYLCLADSAADACPQTWSSCDIACSMAARRGG